MNDITKTGIIQIQSWVNLHDNKQVVTYYPGLKKWGLPACCVKIEVSSALGFNSDYQEGIFNGRAPVRL